MKVSKKKKLLVMNRRTVSTTGPIVERLLTKATIHTIQRVLLGIMGTYIPSPPTMASW